MEDKTLNSLELDFLIKLLACHVRTPLGRARLARLRPSTHVAGIERDLELTAEAVEYMRPGERFGLSQIEDPETALAEAQIEGTHLEPKQVLVLEHLLAVGMDLRAHFRSAESRERFPLLSGVAGRIPDLRRLLSEVRGKVLPNGELDDNASPDLRRIRREAVHARARIHRSLESIMLRQDQAIQEDIVTFRNGRFVIPVRTDSRSRVPGVMHGLSSSGQTTYIEPLAVIDQNNELVRLRDEEQMEIDRILFSITESLRREIDGVKALADAVGELDLVQARAGLALAFDCVRPQISRRGAIMLREARHILLDDALRSRGEGAVPISFELEGANRTMVISGPNAGGKTVVLKTVGLIALMVRMGLHVPAAEAEFPIFDRIFADIGDQQSISANLSTFTAHMRNIAEMARLVSPSSLLLIDEVGTGTDPDEGAALAVAIVDHFRSTGAVSIATTHYTQLKMWASRTPGVLNASVEFDERTLRPTYRLLTGVAGASSGLEIARRMSVPAAILEEAGSLLHPDHVRAGEYLKRLKEMLDRQETLEHALDRERAATAAERARLEEEFSAREASRRAELEQAVARIVRDFGTQSTELIRGLRDRVEAARIKKTASARAARLRQAGRALLRKTETELAMSPETHGGEEGLPEEDALAAREPAEGDRVRVRPLDREGLVESIQDGTYTVAMGAVKFRARREDLALLAPGPKASSAGTSGSFPARGPDIDREFTPEIKVIGMTADEAVDAVDKFLDDAFLAGAESVRIIHGHGKGILRRAIADLLEHHPQVESHNPAPPRQGGGGATIAVIRK